MDQQKIYNKTITIQEVVIKEVQGGSRYSLKDHEGKTFSFFTTKKDGTDTSVFAQYKTMGLRVGDTVMLGYVEDEFTNRDGKNVISKKIINFRETNEQPSQTGSGPQSPRGGANNASGGGSNDAHGRRLALHGMVNGMLAAGATVEIIAKDLPALLRLEDSIDKALNEVRPVNPIEEELPTIEQDSGLSDEDLPPF